jgi:hypothetical protein
MGGSLSHSESMGGGWEDRGSPGLLVDGKAVGGEVVGGQRRPAQGGRSGQGWSSTR